MNPSNAYEQMRTAALEGRELEASVLSRAARKLNRCVQNWDRNGTPKFTEELQEALSFTQRLWTFLQVEATNAEHPLPSSVRKNVFQLSRYVDQTVIKMCSGGSLEQLKSLVEINNKMAAGLAPNRDGEGGAIPEMSTKKVPIGSPWA